MHHAKQLEEKIAFVVWQVDNGATIEDACRKTGIGLQSYYRWRKRFGRLVPRELVRLQALEEENRQLKRTVSDLTFSRQLLQSVIQGSLQSR